MSDYYIYCLILLFVWAGNDSDTKNGLHPYRIAYTNTYGKPPWFEFVRNEYSACREQVGLSDYSSFTKIDFWVCMILHSATQITCFIMDVLWVFLCSDFGNGRFSNWENVYVRFEDDDLLGFSLTSSLPTLHLAFPSLMSAWRLPIGPTHYPSYSCLAHSFGFPFLRPYKNSPTSRHHHFITEDGDFMFLWNIGVYR